MKFAICNEMFEGWSWESICDTARDLGYSGIEVAPFTLAARAELISATQRNRIRASADRRGLQIIGLHWLLVGPPSLYVTHPDAAIRRDTSAYFRELIDLCADLGGHVMVVGSPRQRDLLPGVTFSQAMTFAEEVFKACLDQAARREVVLALEPLGHKETTFLQTAAEAVELIERIGHPSFRLNLDVKAMADESTPIPEIIRAAAPYVAHVQVNDPNLQGPGMGTLDYTPIIAALREIGYDGWLSVEAFDFKLGAEAIGRASIDYLRRVTAKRDGA